MYNTIRTTNRQAGCKAPAGRRAPSSSQIALIGSTRLRLRRLPHLSRQRLDVMASSYLNNAERVFKYTIDYEVRERVGMEAEARP